MVVRFCSCHPEKLTQKNGATSIAPLLNFILNLFRLYKYLYQRTVIISDNCVRVLGADNVGSVAFRIHLRRHNIGSGVARHLYYIFRTRLTHIVDIARRPPFCAVGSCVGEVRQKLLRSCIGAVLSRGVVFVCGQSALGALGIYEVKDLHC